MKRLLLLLWFAGTAMGPAFAGQPSNVSFHAYTTTSDFTAPGSLLEGARVSNAGGGALVFGSSIGTLNYTDPFGYGTHSYAYARWTSPWFVTGFGFSELVSSWNADTPAGTWIQVEMQAITDKATATKWYVMGRWAFGDGDFHRTSVGGQGDGDGYVSIDTFFAKDHPMTAYRLRVSLYKLLGNRVGPTLYKVGALASDMPNANPYVPSMLGGAEGIELSMPAFAQEIHAGEYPQFDGGGEAWCSPTSTSMILAYWATGPSPADYSYVYTDYPNVIDPWVDYAARYVFDYHYQGAGNWPFNNAYAAHYGLDTEVTQLRSLYEAEQFIKGGIPLVASIAFQPNKLTGFLFRSTAGHLLTIVGFTPTGDVISNDPAAMNDASVRHVYDRSQFEKDWLASTGGIVYIMHPASLPLPPPVNPAQPNW